MSEYNVLRSVYYICLPALPVCMHSKEALGFQCKPFNELGDIMGNANAIRGHGMVSLRENLYILAGDWTKTCRRLRANWKESSQVHAYLPCICIQPSPSLGYRLVKKRLEVRYKSPIEQSVV